MWADTSKFHLALLEAVKFKALRAVSVTQQKTEEKGLLLQQQKEIGGLAVFYCLL